MTCEQPKLLANYPDVLKVEEVADALRMEPRTISAKARRGEIPGAFRVGKEWRVNKLALVAWIETGGHAGPPAQRSASEETEPDEPAEDNPNE